MRSILDVLGLSVRGVVHRRVRAALVALSLALVVAMPLAVAPIGSRLAEGWRTAAEEADVVVGAPGSGTGLVMGTVLLMQDVGLADLPYGRLAHVVAVPGVEAVALYRRGRVGTASVIGLSAAGGRRLGRTLEVGRWPAVVGEAVVGAAFAASRGIAVGDRLTAVGGRPGDPSGSGPLRLRVVGVQSPVGTAADGVVWTSLETTWALGGRIHGHGSDVEHAGGEDPRTDDAWEVSLAAFDPVEPAAAPASWHLHGDRDDQPVHAILATTSGPEARDRLLGRAALDPSLLAIQPGRVVDDLARDVAQVGRLVAILTGVVALGAAGLGALVLVLLVRERSDELRLLTRLGASRMRIAAILGVEIALVTSCGLACGLLLAHLATGPLDRLVSALLAAG